MDRQKKDIWRAPGNHAQVRKLSHIMQHGRLVNIANFSVYTAASVIKKFLSKLPGGIFGLENEEILFELPNESDGEKQRQIFCRVVYSLSVPCQHLLVLLFGTFYMISESPDSFGTTMTPDAIGISVAPSLFHTCIHDGQRAKLEDVKRFKTASAVISKIIQYFGCTNLFPRECYEFYARITARTLHLDDDNHSRFRFTPPNILPKKEYKEEKKKNRLNGGYNENEYNNIATSNIQQYHKNNKTFHRLSISADQVQLERDDDAIENDDDDKQSLNIVHSNNNINNNNNQHLYTRQRHSHSTHSLIYLQWVHERQIKRMRTRSEWFLSTNLPMPMISSGDTTLIEYDLMAFKRNYQQIFNDNNNDIVQPIPIQQQQQPIIHNYFNNNNNNDNINDQSLSSSMCSSNQQQLIISEQHGRKSCSSSIGGVMRRRSWRIHYKRPSVQQTTIIINDYNICDPTTTTTTTIKSDRMNVMRR